jgi:GTPase involved in cell partitioning and DNA repair
LSYFRSRKNASGKNQNLEGKDGAYLTIDVPQRTNVVKEPPPHDLKIRWGWTESILSRKTAKLIIYNDIVESLRDWVQDVFFPEEFFFATLSTLDRGKLGEGEVVQGKLNSVWLMSFS